MQNYLKIGSFLNKALVALILALGVIVLISGIMGILMPKLVFSAFILPLADICSETGYIREISTTQFLYQGWIKLRYFLTVAGIITVIFCFFWDSLENKTEKTSVHAVDRAVALESKNRLYAVSLFAITLVGAILRSVNLNQSLWGDEIVTLVIFIKQIKFWRYIELGVSLIYSWLGIISLKLFGESEISGRLPAFLLGIVAIPSIYYVTKRLFSRKEGLLAAVLLCVCYFHIRYSTELRGYTALFLFSLLSSYMFLEIVLNRENTKITGAQIWLTAYTALGALSHFYFIWVLFAQYLTLLSAPALERITGKNIVEKGNIRHTIEAITWGILIAVLLYGPKLIPAIIVKYAVWRDAGDIQNFFHIIGELLAGSRNSIYIFIFLAVMFFSLIDWWRNKKEVLAIYFIGLTLPLIIVKLICKATFPRYFIYLLPIWLIAVTHGFRIISEKCSLSLRPVVISLLVVMFASFQLPATMRYFQYYKKGLQDNRSAGEFIDAAAGVNDRVTAIGLGKMAADHYIKKHKLVYFKNEEELSRQLETGGQRVWCVVAFPTAHNATTEAMYKVVRKKCRLAAHFPGMFADISVYESNGK